jgi:hypothetical protein
MQISFVRSGGFSGALRDVRATIHLDTDPFYVSSDPAYHRVLAPHEAEQLRAGADLSELSHAAKQIALRTSRAADLDHYRLTVKTADGKTCDIDLNTSGASNELQGVSPAVVKLLGWLREESKKIVAHRRAGQ